MVAHLHQDPSNDNQAEKTGKTTTKYLHAAGETFIRKESEISLAFKFKDFSRLAAIAPKRCAYSPRADIDGVRWWLNVYPEGVNADSMGYVSCYLTCDQDMGVSFTISLEHKSGQEKDRHTRKVDHDVLIANQGSGLNRFISREQLRAEYCIADTVTFLVQIVILGSLEAVLTSSCTSTAAASTHSTSNSSALEQPAAKRVRFNKPTMLLDPTFSDVTIILDDNIRLPAHKCILCPRSAVFGAILTDASSELMVQGHSLAAVKAMLHFLYTDVIEEELLPLATQLLSLAVYYQIEDLRCHVEEHCMEHLAADNVKDILQVAQQHGSKALVAKALQFVVEHAKELLLQEDFLTNLDADTSHAMLQAVVAAMA